MGDIALEPYAGGAPEEKKKATLVTVLFVLLCGVLLGWFIIIALSRGDIPASDVFLKTEDTLKFFGQPGSESVTNADVPTKAILSESFGEPSGEVVVKPLSTEEALKAFGTPGTESAWQPTAEEKAKYELP